MDALLKRIFVKSRPPLPDFLQRIIRDDKDRKNLFRTEPEMGNMYNF